MNDNQAAMLLIAGAYAAAKWQVHARSLEVIRVPDNVSTYYLPTGAHLPKPGQERVELERFLHENGESCWLGYSAYHNALLYRPSVPLTSPPKSAILDTDRKTSADQ